MANEVFVPIFVFAELLFGFKNGARERENLALPENFLKLPGVFIQYPTNETAHVYASIALGLKEIGKPIPFHDIWIAACAIETGSIIVTYDKHFLNISGARTWGEH
ncbi:MAG: PIN domain-containing protein [Phaeodactylibacter sp.]|nr:PIN domain-containing protein [Phaeodactylibacter sp.]MCB9303693.1 PIN domain-containing protein [Lewinellaceae bacterium]